MTGNGTGRWFELTVRQRATRREVVLWQVEQRAGDGRARRRLKRQRVGSLSGRALTVAENDLRYWLGRAEVQELERHGRVQLPDALGARFGVLFLTLRPLRRVERMVRLIEGCGSWRMRRRTTGTPNAPGQVARAADAAHYGSCWPASESSAA